MNVIHFPLLPHNLGWSVNSAFCVSDCASLFEGLYCHVLSEWGGPGMGCLLCCAWHFAEVQETLCGCALDGRTKGYGWLWRCKLCCFETTSSTTRDTNRKYWDVWHSWAHEGEPRMIWTRYNLCSISFNWGMFWLLLFYENIFFWACLGIFGHDVCQHVLNLGSNPYTTNLALLSPMPLWRRMLSWLKASWCWWKESCSVHSSPRTQSSGNSCLWPSKTTGNRSWIIFRRGLDCL